MDTSLSTKVDLGIAETVRVVAEILSRRQNRRNEVLADFVSNICDTVDAASEIVKTLDNIFIDLVRGFTDKATVQNPERLQDHVEAVQTYLTSRSLLPSLEDCIGTIYSHSLDERLKNKSNRSIATTLRNLAKKLEQYREQLGRGGMTGVGQKQEWNLETLRERALEPQYGEGIVSTTPIEEVAEQVFRNHDFDLSDNLHRLIGSARTEAKSLMV